MNFQSIASIKPIQIQPTALKQLADQIGNNTKFDPPELPSEITNLKTRAPRHLDEIFRDLENGKADNITPLEWVYCIYHKQNWDEQHSKNEQLSTSQLIWQAALDNEPLKHRLCWRLAYYYDGNNSSLAHSFVQTFSTLADQEDNDNLTVKLLSILKESERYLKIAQLAQDKQLTPFQSFIIAKLPTNLEVIHDTFKYVVEAFSTQSTPKEKHVNWLLSCFQEMELEQETSAVDTLLKSVSAEVGGQFPSLVRWLQDNYGSHATGSKWGRLSFEGKNALRQWFGAANYQDFQKLVNIILKRLDLPQWEENQLDSRKYFWQHYSDQFERIRILLPQSSVNIVGNQLKQDIDLLKDDGSEPTEICIFDFGDWFVVEFFRGTGSETRLFDRYQNPYIEKELFESSELSVKRLRALGGEVHDHKYLWQVYCEEWLRKRGILPNDGINKFKRPNKNNPNKPHSDTYSQETGIQLKDPDGKKNHQREKDLVKWRKDIERLEREAKRYVDDD